MNPSRISLTCCVVALSLVPKTHAEPPRWDKTAARSYLDTRAGAWLDWSVSKRHGGDGTTCISCHTAMPAALALPHLGDASTGEKQLVANSRARVERWKEIVEWSGTAGKIRHFYPSQKSASLATEAVLNALILVEHDVSRNEGKLGDATRKALSHLWAHQNKDTGGHDWLNFNLRPWERDAEYFGTALAAVAVGKAGQKYYTTQLTTQQKKKLDKLRTYLKTKFAAQPLHNRLAALWASTHLPGVLTEQQQKKLIDETLAIDKNADAWSFASLAKKQNDNATWPIVHTIPESAKYDGYATAFIAFALTRAGSTAAKLDRAKKWLADNNVPQGKGPVAYPNRERNPDSMTGQFLRDAASAYSVLALTHNQPQPEDE